MSVVERFLRYIRFDTQSSETSGTTPSTPGQRVFAEALVKELQELGLEEIELDEKSYLMATLPANTEKNIPVIGFIAHLDTSPDMSGKNVSPRIVSYQGGEFSCAVCFVHGISPFVFVPIQYRKRAKEPSENTPKPERKTHFFQENPLNSILFSE